MTEADAREEIYEPCNSLLATPSWKAQCATWGIEVDDALEMAEQAEI